MDSIQASPDAAAKTSAAAIERWEAAAQKIDVVRSEALAQVRATAPLSWWQTRASFALVMTALFFVMDVAMANYWFAAIMFVFVALYASGVRTEVKESKALNPATTMAALDVANSEASKILDAADQADVDETYSHLYPKPAALPQPAYPSRSEPWGPGSLPLPESSQHFGGVGALVRHIEAKPLPEPRYGQSDAAMWNYVNSTPSPRPVPARVDRERLNGTPDCEF